MQEPFPTVLVKETNTLKEWDGSLHTRVYYWTGPSMDNVLGVIRELRRPGFGQEYESIRYEVFTITATLSETIVPEPVSMLEGALTLESYNYSGCTTIGPNLKVKIGLRGKGYDPASVYWTNGGNSFAIVKPDPNIPTHINLTTKQGVMLVSINGIGEIRWDVTRSSCQHGDDKEAFNHFNLSW